MLQKKWSLFSFVRNIYFYFFITYFYPSLIVSFIEITERFLQNLKMLFENHKLSITNLEIIDVVSFLK